MAITRGNAIIEVTTVGDPLITVPADTEAIVVSIIIGNIDAGAAAGTVSLVLTKDGASAVTVVKDIPVGAGEAVEFLINGRGNMFLQAGDVLSATADADDRITATISYLLDA